MQLSPQQSKAIAAVADWFHTGNSKPFFYLAGYAGTGKTTLARHFAEGVEGDVLFAAYTGKAALQLRKAGAEGASTIHSLVYKLVKPDIAQIREIEAKLKNIFPGDEQYQELAQSLHKLREPHFTINRDSEISSASLVILDECSMIDEEMANDLLSFEVPILVLGDPGQLPPIKGQGYFTQTPDVMLTKIHRQAKDNPIIALSLHVREHGNVPFGFSKTAGAFPQSKLLPSSLKGASQIICGKNATRRFRNLQLRKLLGFGLSGGVYPETGDKVIALKNVREAGVFNGLLGEVTAADPTPENFRLNLSIHTEEGKDLEDIKVLTGAFDEYLPNVSNPMDKIPTHIIRNSYQFDYGYAITCHKAQGSQFDRVLVIDDGMFAWGPKYAEQRKQWLYTAVTRAVESVAVIRAKQ